MKLNCPSKRRSKIKIIIDIINVIGCNAFEKDGTFSFCDSAAVQSSEKSNQNSSTKLGISGDRPSKSNNLAKKEE